MKRYDSEYHVHNDGGMTEKENGQWVKYDDIKSDRALLDDAVEALSAIRNTYIMDYALIGWEKVDSIIARAKEGLVK